MRVPTGHLGKKTGASSGHKTNRNISRAGIALYSLTGRIRHAKWSAMGERRHMQHAKKKLWRDQTSTVGNTTPTVGRRCARKRPVAPRARAWAGTLSDFASKLTAGLSTARSGTPRPRTLSGGARRARRPSPAAPGHEGAEGRPRGGPSTAPAGGAPCAGACRGLEVPASRRGAALGARQTARRRAEAPQTSAQARGPAAVEGQHCGAPGGHQRLAPADPGAPLPAGSLLSICS
ncbi:unnamed protein product, partial [Prorocentrum cordatum]